MPWRAGPQLLHLRVADPAHRWQRWRLQAPPSSSSSRQQAERRCALAVHLRLRARAR